MNNPIQVILLFLTSLFLSCSQSNYIPISEVPEIEFDTLSNITQTEHSFLNITNNQNVSILNTLDETGFHFYNGFKFKTEDIGIVVGGTGLRARITQNGGTSWKEFSFSKFADALHSVAFSGTRIFCIGESNYIFRTNDFGETWVVYNSKILFKKDNSLSQVKFYKIRFFDDQLGFIAGEHNNVPTLLKTNDGGEQWELIDTTKSLKNKGAITDFFIHSAEKTTIVTSLGECYRIADSGKTWKLIHKTNPLNCIAFKNNTGFIGGLNGTLIYTSNDGKDWSKIDVPENPNITDIVFIDDTALITTSIPYSDNRTIFVYRIDENGKNIQPFLTKNDPDVHFMGDSYAIDVFENNVYILDRNNLYKVSNK